MPMSQSIMSFFGSARKPPAGATRARGGLWSKPNDQAALVPRLIGVTFAVPVASGAPG